MGYGSEHVTGHGRTILFVDVGRMDYDVRDVHVMRCGGPDTPSLAPSAGIDFSGSSTADADREKSAGAPGSPAAGNAAWFGYGETLCHQLLREAPSCMALSAGPLPFFPGNKLTVGYMSPLTELPHYSLVGGRAAAQMFFLGLDALVLQGKPKGDVEWYLVVEGRAPEIRVRFEPSAELPRGQRAALYWLAEHELGGDQKAGSLFTLGYGAYHWYPSSNIAVEGIFHAGRGGAGNVFARRTHALVLKGLPVAARTFLGRDRNRAFKKLIRHHVSPRLRTYCAWLGRANTGTIGKLPATGADTLEHPTLPTHNATRLTYAAAGLGNSRTLRAARDGHTACHWCRVRCRHYSWVPADYAPDGRDALLDDFEPAYAVCAMLDIQPSDTSEKSLLKLRRLANEKLFLPIEQMGLDVIDVGTALAALFEGVERKLIPAEHVPEFLREGPLFGDITLMSRTLELLGQGGAGFVAVRAMGEGPEGLAKLYPDMKDRVFTCGRTTLGNAGHCNALWTFLMPFSRFFSHNSGRLYEIDEDLPAGCGDEEARAIFARVVERMIQRELIGILSNALSLCTFVFRAFTEDGKGRTLDTDTFREVMTFFDLDADPKAALQTAEAFLAESIRFRLDCGWQPPGVREYPARVLETVSHVIGTSPERCRELFALLIDEWKRGAGTLLKRHGIPVRWRWTGLRKHVAGGV